jgi:hypothetical protein
VSSRHLIRLGIATAVVLAACSAGETRVSHVARLRRSYRVELVGLRSGTAADGTPELEVDLLVVNLGRETLRSLTLLFHVQGPDGRDRLERRASLDVAALVPGIATPSRVAVVGVALGPGENLLVELEEAPPADALAAYPEYLPACRSAP